MDQKLDLNKIIKILKENPAIGQEQKGDLRGIYIYQFHLNETNYLLSYRLKETTIEIITFGPREKYFKTINITGPSQTK